MKTGCERMALLARRNEGGQTGSPSRRAGIQDMSGALAVDLIVGALTGAIAAPALTIHGLAQLTPSHASHRWLWLVSAVAGGAAGMAAIEASRRAQSWLVAPALCVWACALVAAACCDAVTKRIPTPLVRQAGIGTLLLLSMGFAIDGDWRGLLLSSLAAAASGLTVLLCWRFAGAGFGDVRVATLGGLGLGHASVRGLALAVLALCVIVLVQAIVILSRGGNRQSTLPFGPALVTGLLLAAAS